MYGMQYVVSDRCLYSVLGCIQNKTDTITDDAIEPAPQEISDVSIFE